MKVYLVDDYKIYTYSLPNKIEDAFMINYVHYTGEDETITFVAENNKWVIESTPEIMFVRDNSRIEKESIEIDYTYTIQFSDLNDTIYLYCFDPHQELFDYMVDANSNRILLGNSGNFDILYNSSIISNPEIAIIKHENMWFVQDNSQSKLYVNNRRVKNTYLNFGDVIFVKGLKIIWFESFIKINNPNGLVKTNLPKSTNHVNLAENTYTPVKDTEKSVVLYNDNQVFFHTPRIKEDIISKEFEIERPPQIIENEDMPAILSVGATAVMALSSIYTGVTTLSKLSSNEISFENALPELMLTLTMVLGVILFPILIDRYSRKKIKIKEANRQKTYREYLDSLRKEIANEVEKEKKILIESNHDSEKLKNGIEKLLIMIF